MINTVSAGSDKSVVNTDLGIIPGAPASYLHSEKYSPKDEFVSSDGKSTRQKMTPKRKIFDKQKLIRCTQAGMLVAGAVAMSIEGVRFFKKFSKKYTILAGASAFASGSIVKYFNFDTSKSISG